jgi:hypothetical protein
MRRDHRALQTRLTSLRRIAAPGPSAAASARLHRAIGRFLADWGPRLRGHLDQEARLVTPGVVRSLPAETWTRETFTHEQETIDAVMDLLRDGCAWLERGEPGAEREIAAALDDLLSLWSQHVRRLDVLAPLLQEAEGRGRA